MKKIILFFCLTLVFAKVSNAQTDVINIIPGGNVGISSTAPLSSLEVSGSYGQKVTTITANTPLDGTHNTVVCNNGATAITVTLPTASTATGRVYVIKKNAASTANVTITGNPTLDGAGTYILTMPNQSIQVFSDGSEWKTTSGGSSGNSTAWGLNGNSGTTASTSPIGTAANNNFIGTADAKDFVLATTGLERMRIASGGNVGIGITNPEVALHIATQSISTPRGLMIQQSNNANNSPFIILRKDRGTIGAPAAIVNGDALGTIYSEGYDGTSFTRSGTNIKFVSNGTVATGSIPSDIVFNTGSSGIGTERMRILSSGEVGIGTSVPGYKLDVRSTSVGQAAFIRSDAVTGTNYGIDAEAMGVGAATNIGGYFAASGATNNYAIIVPSGFGNVGIGNTAPNSFKVQVAGDVGPNADLTYNLGSAALRWNNLYVNSIQGPGALWTRSGTNLYNTTLTDNVGIGTVSPTSFNGSKLAIAGNLAFQNDQTAYFIQGPGNGGAIRIRANTGVASDRDVQLGHVDNAGVWASILTAAESGNVGIGTTSPTEKLHINGGSIRLNYAAGETPYQISGYASGTSLWQIAGSATTAKTVFATGFDWDRQVAITYTPGTTGAAAGNLQIGQIDKNNTNWTHGITQLYTNGAERMRIQANGNVGINSTGPTQKLDVTGNTNVAGHMLQSPVVARPLAVWSGAGTTAGAVIIKLPGTIANYGMLHMQIDVYEYGTQGVTTYYIGGHNWNDGRWYNYNCHTIGNSTKKIRLAVKDNQFAIVLGEAGSSWSYGSVALTKIVDGGYYSGVMDLGGTYTITQDNSAESYSWISADLNSNVTEGSGTPNYLARWLTSNTLGIGVTYDNGTNVGIGMGSGAISKLHTSGTLTVGPNATANATGNVQLTTGGSSPISNRLVYGTDGSGWKFAIGKNQGGTVTDQLTIQDNGLIGIGTSSPSYALDVTSTVANSSRVYIHPSTGTEYALLQFSNNGGTSYFGMDNSGGGGLGSGTAYALTTYAAGTVPITMATNGSERLRIISSGNVGIGSTSPGTKLDVSGGSVRTTNQLISTVATGTAPLDVSSTTNVTNLNADLLDGRHARELQFMQSDRDFPNGTLIKTDIVYGDYGEPWLLEIEGNSYGNLIPIDIKIQGYIYPAPYMYNVAGISNGTNITGLSAFNFGGNLCFWFPTQGYWNGYSVFVNDSYAGVKHNRLVSITHEAKPVAITKEVELSSLIRQSVHSGNISSNAIQNQYSGAQSANFWISGIANVENEYRLDNVAAITGSGTDVYANIRVIRNLSTVNTDGMYIGYSGSGGPLRFFANSGSTEHMTLNTDGNLVFNDYGKGIVGTYSATRYQAVFSMGDAYRLSTDGTSVGNLYGIAWTHTNIAGQSKAGLAHQALFMNAGVTQTAIGTGIWTLGDLTAPIMYDYNDPSYYVDPAGATRLNRFTAVNCKICLYWVDNNNSFASSQKQCVSMASNATNNVSNFIDFSGDVDENDRMWIGFECP